MINWLKNFFTTKPGEGMIPISSKDIKFDVEKEVAEINAEVEDKMKEQEELEWIYMGDGMMEQVKRRKEFNTQTPVSSRSSYSSSSSNDYVSSAVIYNSISSSDSSSYDSGSCDSGSSSSCD